MASLVDCFPGELRNESVEVMGRQVDIRPIKAGGFAQLGARFPKFLNSAGGIDMTNMSDEFVAAVIAAGTGGLGNKKWEATAAALPLEAQAKLFEAIMRITMPPKEENPSEVPEDKGAPSESARVSKSSKRSTSLSARDTKSDLSGT